MQKSVGMLKTCSEITSTVEQPCMHGINILTIQRISAGERVKIEAVDPAVQLTDAEAGTTGRFAPRRITPRAMHDRRLAMCDNCAIMAS